MKKKWEVRKKKTVDLGIKFSIVVQQKLIKIVYYYFFFFSNIKRYFILCKIDLCS